MDGGRPPALIGVSSAKLEKTSPHSAQPSKPSSKLFLESASGMRGSRQLPPFITHRGRILTGSSPYVGDGRDRVRRSRHYLPGRMEARQAGGEPTFRELT